MRSRMEASSEGSGGGEEPEPEPEPELDAGSAAPPLERRSSGPGRRGRRRPGPGPGPGGAKAKKDGRKARLAATRARCLAGGRGTVMAVAGRRGGTGGRRVGPFFLDPGKQNVPLWRGDRRQATDILTYHTLLCILASRVCICIILCILRRSS